MWRVCEASYVNINVYMHSVFLHSEFKLMDREGIIPPPDIRPMLLKNSFVLLEIVSYIGHTTITFSRRLMCHNSEQCVIQHKIAIIIELLMKILLSMGQTRSVRLLKFSKIIYYSFGN